jgi:hypothetical protein
MRRGLVIEGNPRHRGKSTSPGAVPYLTPEQLKLLKRIVQEDLK